MKKFENRKILVTGASRGIGEAIAKAFHAHGAIVGLHGTNIERLEGLAAQLGERVHVFPANLMVLDEAKELASRAEKEMDGVEIVVNNAGITKDNLLLRMSEEAWRDVVAVNLDAVFAICKVLAGAMIRRRFGRIINISSVLGVMGNAGQSNYCATKAGVIGFSKALAQEVASRNITVNCIAPGFIESDMTNKLQEKQKENILSSIPMARMGKVEDIAGAALFLAGEDANYITGQTLHVNGGMAMI